MVNAPFSIEDKRPSIPLNNALGSPKPLAIDESQLDQSFIDKEREIFKEQLKDSGKPENILEKIVEGKISKYLSEVTLLDQSWIMEPGKKVKNIIEDFNKDNNENFTVKDYVLFVLGEGVDVIEKSFKEEVADQIKEKNKS